MQRFPVQCRALPCPYRSVQGPQRGADVVRCLAVRPPGQLHRGDGASRQARGGSAKVAAQSASARSGLPSQTVENSMHAGSQQRGRGRRGNTHLQGEDPRRAQDAVLDRQRPPAAAWAGGGGEGQEGRGREAASQLCRRTPLC